MYWITNRDEKSNIWLIVCPFTKKKKPSDCRELHIKSTFKLMHIPFHLNNPYCRSVVVLTVFSLNQTEPELKAIALKCLTLLLSWDPVKKANINLCFFWLCISRQLIIRLVKEKKHWKFYLFGLSIRLLQFPNNVCRSIWWSITQHKCINKLDLLHVQLHWWEK